MTSKHQKDFQDVLIIGCGGAGLRAGIEVKKNGLSTKIIGKRPKNDAHTVLAAGGINASFGNLDKDDCWEQHFSDTFLEGYQINDPESIEILVKNAANQVSEIDKWGANLKKLPNGKFDQRYFGAHTYRRTCYSGDYTGQSILFALLEKANHLNIPIDDSAYVTDLLIKNNQCFGAISINVLNGEKKVHFSNSVILCTGGHTRIWSKSSSRYQENMGDGFHLALKAGCELIDMEMVQFHPTGMLSPKDIAGTLVTEAVRGEGGKLFNSKGLRFMINYDEERMELSSRDRVAVANYTEIIEGRGTPNGGVFLDISHKNKEFIISKLPKIYKQFLDYQMLDISKEPMEVAPTAHYSMGGILVNPKDHSTKVKGLYASGEVAGGLHGANRLGGNSLAEILVFGKITGENASKFSLENKSESQLNHLVDLSLRKIDIKCQQKGDFEANFVINELREIMWKYCGVIKNEKLLKEGLKRIDKLKDRSIDINIEKNNYQKLINYLDLKSSLITAESTIRSSLHRCESRGSHQRKDFPQLNLKKYNYITFIDQGVLKTYQKKSKEPKEKLIKFLNETNYIKDFKDKLIE
tara:strand:- start:747 stop:2489 length:1743 start_codon:yes stop_codon:yes gene_type:complete